MKSLFKIFIFSLLAFGTAFSATAASPQNGKSNIAARCEPPDMTKIKREVNDPNSRYYYPKLMAAYEKNDTVMTLDDYRHLYLGTVFQEDYNPYRRGPMDNLLDELYYKKTHTRAELDSIISYAEIALEDDPFDLSQINFLIYALRERGKQHRANIWQYRLNHLLEAILSTGTGLDSEHAWVVIDPKHEYNIVNFQNAIVEQVNFEAPHYDHITIRPSKPAAKSSSATEAEAPHYYFDIQYILREYFRKHPEEMTQ
ncbi:MAG: DUF4919 domain-containing protein [Muribaculaceae bacterium]|nr:DUF4919 domain-containing protein [Muribaculaceae bacterium]MDE5969053.1 DUF4919 domain-containing protein [Muribaculaceae bacterium]MDE7393587.1 DUF4919 domain-containing protein [Muribaculaceae bacterium]